MRILNPNFIYVPASHTNLQETFKRHGFKPTTDAEREAAQQRLHSKRARPSLRAVKRSQT